jgi:probable phosphomutase (TIGR03848 family)
MATVVLVRHGRSTANTAGVLAGRAPGVSLDDTGRAQARNAGERLAEVPLSLVVSSPLERCRQTARAVVKGRTPAVAVRSDRGLTECDYGDWQGRALKDLSRSKLWRTVQGQPSAAVFPGGESMAAMQARGVAAVRRWDVAVEEEHGAGAVWVAVSHGDVIKAILADALGTHLDHFQRIQVDPGSISVVRYTETRPYVVGSNTHEGSLRWLAQPVRRRRRTEAAVGGGAGPDAAR